MRLKNIKKEKKGISLVVLLIVIGVMLILLSTITISLDNIVTNSKKRQFAKEIYEIQSMVDTYKKQNDDYPYVKLAEGTTSVGPRAFADCPNLFIIYVPTQTEIDPTAFDGSYNAYIYRAGADEIVPAIQDVS